MSRLSSRFILSLIPKPSPLPQPAVTSAAWLALLSAGLSGAALCLASLAPWNALSPARGLNDVASKTAVVGTPQLSGNADPSWAASSVPQMGNASEMRISPSKDFLKPSPEQIDRFARALLAVQPLLAATQIVCSRPTAARNVGKLNNSLKPQPPRSSPPIN
ncbi:hypothetical protein [Synechococcus sp. H55.11]|uniref:hypothetical protein n=1 Tax=Synechococcus sp. H55.11 TaxID=2967121 RepID=UPI0039C3491F